MKEINLIPSEARDGFSEGWLKSQLLMRKIPAAIFFTALLFIIASVWQISAGYRYQWVLANANKELSQLQAQSASAALESKDIISEKEKIAKDIVRMEEKLILLSEAKVGEIKWAPVFVRLSKLVPPQIWLGDISMNKDLITMRGTAFDNSAISGFMVALDRNDFTNTAFSYTQKAKLDDTGVMNFEITTQIKK